MQELFDEALASNLAPTIITFNCLIAAYGAMGMWNEAVRVGGKAPER